MTDIVERLPAHVLTGFLGSGKTTLLRRVLTDPAFADSAVIINELGEVGLDHELVSIVADNTVVMPGGCLCCTIREDIETTLRELFAARDSGKVAPFRRLFIETTGIADPQPLVHTLHASPLAASRLLKPEIVTVVDGVLGADTLARHAEATAQAAAADIIVISKQDLGGGDSLPALLRRLNPWAPIRGADLLAPDLDPFGLLSLGDSQLCPPGSAARDTHIDGTHAHGAHEHVGSLSLELDQPLDWTGFGIWLTMLLHCHGPNVLRMKAMLNVAGSLGPVVLHSAQHLVHPPEHLEHWSGTERRSRLVFVVRGLDPRLIERSLKMFDVIAKLPTLQSDKVGYLSAGAGGTIAGRPVRRATAPRWIKG